MRDVQAAVFKNMKACSALRQKLAVRVLRLKQS